MTRRVNCVRSAGVSDVLTAGRERESRFGSGIGEIGRRHCLHSWSPPSAVRPSRRPAHPNESWWTARDAIRPGGWQPDTDSDGVCTCTILLVRCYYYWICFCVWTALARLNSALTGPCGCVSVLARLDVGCSAVCSCGACAPVLAPCCAYAPVGRSGQTMDCYKSSGASGACGHLSAVCCSRPFFSNSHGFSAIIMFHMD